MNNPWKGLACYEEEDLQQYKFCGRDKSIRELNTLIQNNLCITMYGRTGIGKTSLLKAGVFPLLRKDRYLPVLVRFNNLDEYDSLDYATYIINQINKAVAEIKVNDYAKATDNNVDVLWEYFATRHFYNEDGREVFPIIVLDQFEENFLRAKMKQKAWRLMEQLYSLTDDNKAFPEGYHNETNFRIVISIREDDLFRLEDCIDTLNLTEFKYNRYRLVRLTDEEAREIIRIPGDAVLSKDEKVRNHIIRRIIELVKNGNDNNLSTLMLSLVCSQLFDNAQTNGNQPLITNAIIDGMSHNLLQDFYLSVIKALPDNKERQYIEDNLVDAHGRRNSINKDIMEENCPDWHLLTEGTSRILQETNGKVELVHDMLAQAVFETRESRKEAERVVALEQEKEMMRRKNRRKMLIASSIVVLSVLICFFMFWQVKKAKAANWKMLENNSRAVAAKAMELVKDGDSYTARLLALEVLPKDLNHPDRPYTLEAENALRMALMEGNEILRGHTDGVNSASFSPDGKMIVSASNDETIRLWDVATGEQIGEPLEGHTGIVTSASFSPDGKMIVSASWDATIRLWDVATGEQIGEPLEGHTDGVTSASFSPDGEMIVSASYDRTIRLWDVATGEQIGEPLEGHTYGVTSASFSPDGKMIVSASWDETISLRDVATGEQIGAPLEGHTDWVTSASFSPDGKMIVSASKDETIRLRDVATGEQIGAPLEGHTDWVTSASFSPDGKMIVSASWDKTIRIWEWPSLQDLIDKTRERFKDRELTPEERSKYYIE